MDKESDDLVKFAVHFGSDGKPFWSVRLTKWDDLILISRDYDEKREIFHDINYLMDNIKNSKIDDFTSIEEIKKPNPNG